MGRGKGCAGVPFHLASLRRPLSEKTFEQSPRDDAVSDRENEQ